VLSLGSWEGVSAERVGLPEAALLRHVLALGSSGSGKTVFCKVVAEEAVRAGIPVLAVDPQGDLVSLALAGDEAELIRRGVDVEAAVAFRERADVVVFTPASTRGIPLCADPVEADAPDDPNERLAARTRVATMVASLLGYDPAGDEGAGLVAVLDRCLASMEASGAPMSLAALGAHMNDAAVGGFAEWARYLDPKKIRGACQKLARLDVGARRLLFSEGVPIDIEALLGLGRHAVPGRVRVAIIYLNTLHSQEDKDLIVATLADRLYRWMLKNPKPTPQALFYIDEVAPFVPPVRKPACKEGLTLLFKQARKYGVGCLMATQNPGDVDYRAMGQFGTWALGRLSTRQDLKKIEPSLRALAPDAADEIARQLPRLGPGQLILLSPDHHEAPVPLQTRWLYSDHRTIDEDGLAEVVTREMRARFAPLVRTGQVDQHAPTRSVVRAPTRPETPTPVPPPPSSPEEFLDLPTVPGLPPVVVSDASLGGPEPLFAERVPASALTLETSIDGLTDRRDDQEVRYRKILAKKTSMSVKEFAERAKMSATKARRVLAELVEGGHAGRYKEGRGHQYWATTTGGRPDLGLPRKVKAVAAVLGPDDAEALAERMARGKIFGILGDAERFLSAELVHRLLYRIDFDEKVPAPVLTRFFGNKEDVLEGSVYLHPRSLSVLVLSTSDGMAFVDAPGKHASAVEDLDGVAAFVDVPPGALTLDDGDYEDMAKEKDAKKRFGELFEARARSVKQVFVPLWRFKFDKGGRRKVRVVWVDAIMGRPVAWE